MSLDPGSLIVASGGFAVAAGLNVLAEVRPKLRPSAVVLAGIVLGVVGVVLGAVLVVAEMP